MNNSRQKRILHLSHVDIKTDSRTLKQIYSAEQCGYDIVALGVQLDEGAAESKKSVNAQIISFNLLVRYLRLPKILMHALVLIELSIRMLFVAPKYRPDIIHCSDTMVLPIGALLKIICSAKLVYDAHELESQKNGSTRITSFVTLTMERMLWRLVDALIVVSPSIDGWYKEHLGEKFSRVVLNSPMFDQSETKTQYLREKFNIAIDQKIFLYIGIFGVGRGIEEILEVFSKPDIGASVVFLGHGPLKDEILSAVDSHSNIFLHQSVEHEQVVPITMSADVGICLLQNISLSDYYSLPNKFFEYIFSGIPVIASDFPDLRSYTEEYNVGVCTEFSTKSLIKSVEHFVSQDEPLVVDVLALEALSWDTQGNKLVETYDYVIQRNENPTVQRPKNHHSHK